MKTAKAPAAPATRAGAAMPTSTSAHLASMVNGKKSGRTTPAAPVALGGAALALVGGALLYRSIRGRRDDETPSNEPEVERSITIGASAEDLYRSWREPATLTRIMGRVAEVSAADEGRTHWSARGPLGRRLEWDTQFVEDRPGEFLRWESLAGAAVPNAGALRFSPAPGGRGTEVALRIRVDPPGGALGDAALRRLGVVPGLLAEGALRRFKSLVETGEIPTLAHNPSARDQ